MRRFKLNRDKLRDAVCKVVDTCAPRELGAVKLHKVLYYADMLTFLEDGYPITGATYRKRKFGPTCDAVLQTIDELEKDGFLSVEQVDYHGYQKREFQMLKRHNSTSLDSGEVATLEEMVDFVCKRNTAKTISDFSHDMVWDMFEFGQDISYQAALNMIPAEDSKEAHNWATSMQGEIENTQPLRASDVEGGAATPLRDFMAQHT